MGMQPAWRDWKSQTNQAAQRPDVMGMNGCSPTCFSDRARHLRTISPSSARRSSTPMLASVYLASLVCPCLFTSSTNLRNCALGQTTENFMCRLGFSILYACKHADGNAT